MNHEQMFKLSKIKWVSEREKKIFHKWFKILHFVSICEETIKTAQYNKKIDDV